MPSNDSVAENKVSEIEQACAELSRRLRAGENCSALEIAQQFQELVSDPGRLLELVLTELSVRRQLGEQPTPQEWYTRYPQWREPLRQWFETATQGTVAPGLDLQTLPLPLPELRERVPPPPKAFGRYELIQELGRGGMGVVYKARDTALGRIVALKMIRGSVLASAEEIERFCREARAAAQLQHSNIVVVYDIEQHEGEHFLTMEFAGGGSLTGHRDLFGGDTRKAAALVEKVARALHHAHANGILHRDLKPGNILLDDKGEPRVADFGLAKFLDSDVELTRTGAVVGTPAYMAPEQTDAQSGAVSPASDVWSLGVVLYELLTGQRPFGGGSTAQLRQHILTGVPRRPRLRRPELDRDLETVVLKCLEKDPAWRYASAGDLADDLARWLNGESIQARPASRAQRSWRALRRLARSYAVWAALLVVGAGAGAYVVYTLRDIGASDQNQEQEKQRQQLIAAVAQKIAAGEEAVLVGPAGLPRWHRWVVGRDQAFLGPGLAGTLDIETFRLGLVELLPDPQTEHYRFRAEVQLTGTNDGDAGVYFLHEERALSPGPEHYFYAVTFSDRGIVGGRVYLKLFRYREPVEGANMVRQELQLAQIALPPAPPDGWRQIAVDIAPKGLVASFDGVQLAKIVHAQSEPLIAAWWRTQFGAPPAQPLPSSAPRSAFGLYVRRADASFRNITVSPPRKEQ
jgi:serine/threonine-protein kinase